MNKSCEQQTHTCHDGGYEDDARGSEATIECTEKSAASKDDEVAQKVEDPEPDHRHAKSCEQGLIDPPGEKDRDEHKELVERDTEEPGFATNCFETLSEDTNFRI